MSKALLLLDEMPVRCLDCPCMYVVKTSHTSECEYCKATIDKKDCYLKIENVCERPKWCPLKEMPKEKEVPFADKLMFITELSKEDTYNIGKAEGWNSCIDFIEREENEL